MPHLLDSDIMVDLTRGSCAAADYLDGLDDAWSISTITCLELVAGARTQRETNDLDLVLSAY
jgi:predicted nucleic acid-binding protein